MSIKTIDVFLDGYELEQKVGTLAYKDRTIYFEYDQSFLDANIELSPYKLSLKPGVHICDDNIFDGLFGVFSDSLPDGWGRLLLDRYFLKQNIKYRDITPLDRLAYIGEYGTGALVYKPYIDGVQQDLFDIDLNTLATKSMKILKDEETDLEELLSLGGSSAGARPKIMVQIDDENNIISGSQKLQNTYQHYMIKFSSQSDSQEMGKIEYIYSLIAKDAKIDMPDTKLLQNRYFAIKRFDRIEDKRVHMHSVAGLIHSDFRYPSLDYDDLLALTLHLTKDIKEQEKMFRLAVFNLFTHNRDDHAKNFSFILDKNFKWKLSPAYDLTYSNGPGGEHSTTYLGEGKNPNINHLQKLAKKHSIKNGSKIIEEVREAVERFPEYRKKYNLKMDVNHYFDTM